MDAPPAMGGAERGAAPPPTWDALRYAQSIAWWTAFVTAWRGASHFWDRALPAWVGAMIPDWTKFALQMGLLVAVMVPIALVLRARGRVRGPGGRSAGLDIAWFGFLSAFVVPVFGTIAFRAMRAGPAAVFRHADEWLAVGAWGVSLGCLWAGRWRARRAPPD